MASDRAEGVGSSERGPSVRAPALSGRHIRVVTFGSNHPFTQPALRVVKSLEGFQHVGHVRTFDERDFLRNPNSDESRAFLASLRPDLFLSSGYGRILSEPTLTIPSIGAINVHPSLLPRFRGRDAVRWALYEGASEVGVTIHEMTLPVDSGPVLIQKRLQLDERADADEIYARLAELVPTLLEEVLSEIRESGIVAGTTQPRSGESQRDFPWHELERLALDWTEPADELVRRAAVFPNHCHARVGPWGLYFRGVERISRPPGTIVRRRLRTLDVVAGDEGTVRLHLERPLRAWAKLVLRSLGLRRSQEFESGTLLDARRLA
jgi:methionyl-tRNA formyltransferase